MDLKDAFFYIPLHPDPQYLFTFEWTNPDSGLSQQLTWTALPQEFTASPHLFGIALATEFKEVSLPNGAIL